MLDLIPVIQLAATVLIIPLISAIWSLNASIADLKITLHKDFVTRTEFEKERDKNEKARYS